MHINENYPPEIVEWITELLQTEFATEKQKRMAKILYDKNVIKTAQHVFEQLNKTPNPNEATQRLADFWYFIEDAAALPDREPLGARLHTEKKTEFFTKKEIRDELCALKRCATSFSNLLTTRSKLVHFDKLEELKALLNAFLETPQMSYAFDKEIEQRRRRSKWDKENSGKKPEDVEEEIPLLYEDMLPNPGRTEGTDGWQNEILEKLFLIADLRLRNKYPTFVREIHRVLLGLEIPINASAARDHQGLKTRLVSDI